MVSVAPSCKSIGTKMISPLVSVRGRSPICVHRVLASLGVVDEVRAKVMSMGGIVLMFVRTFRLPVTPQLAPVSAIMSVVCWQRKMVGSEPSRPTVVAMQWILVTVSNVK